ncbi:glutathione binding-like protein [Chitinibacteraceae bacterium HSL-7]
MKLYYKPGACSMAAHIVLNELALPFVLERTDTRQGVTESGRRYADVNPNGYVPALELASGQVLTENVALLEYLADLAPEKALAPAAASFERVRMREMLAFLSAELHKAFSPFFAEQPLSETARQQAEAAVHKRLRHLETRLEGSRGAYLLGDVLSVADIYAFVILTWTQFVGVSLQRWPALQAFSARLAARPSVMAAMEREGLLGTGSAS